MSAPQPPSLELQKRFESALIHRAMGEKEAAVREFRAVLAALPAYTPARSALAVMFAEDGQNEEAVVEFQTLIKADPDDLGAYVHLAMLHEKADQPDQARSCYDAFLERVKDSSPEHAAYVRGRLALLERAPPKPAAPLPPPSNDSPLPPRVRKALLAGACAIALAAALSRFGPAAWDSFERWRWPVGRSDSTLVGALELDAKRWRVNRVARRYKEVEGMVEKAELAGNDVLESRRRLRWALRLLDEGRTEYAAALLDATAISIPRKAEAVRVAETEDGGVDTVGRDLRANRKRGRPSVKAKGVPGTSASGPAKSRSARRNR